MAGWFTNSNVDAAELAAVYRTPDQGVSAKSNSNIAINDYRKMPPLLNQGTGNSGAVVPSGSTIQYQDLQETGGIITGTNTYTTGSTKGTTSYTIVGAFTAGAAAAVRTDGSATAQGSFRLGSTNQTMPSLNGVAGFGSGDYLAGIGSENAGLSGNLYFVVYNAGGAGNIANADWNTIYSRLLYPNGTITTNNITIYNTTLTANRSDTAGEAPVIYSWTSTTSGNYRIWTATHGFVGLYATSPFPSSANYPYIIEIT